MSLNQRDLRRWHQRIGLFLAPFLFLQGLSGLILTYGVFTQVASTLAEEAPEPVQTAWSLIMAKTHYGPGLFGWIYHSLVGLGLLWMILSGVWIWWDLHRRKREGASEE